ncbi:eEF1A lysine and N-terminal methyltransferase homolog isoform X1 [Bacillus rossius redtenbacheri]|uniref:eEF1A lysine and N-terminal methyltransferase homolog isoform X1 n=1 Tax=Bacillus rossius redtenbacheri TaxID=93214 RepID=UPI002FDE839B
MNLLPKSHEEFSQQEYWNTFFKKRGSKAFEWYGEYPELCGLLHKYIKPKDAVLVIGCGNSVLSADLYDVGYRNITNIDISHVVVRQMRESQGKDRPDMAYLQMDALDMTFPDGRFSAVLDKGTLDALMPDDSGEAVARVDKLFLGLDRVLRVGGRYVCVSLLQEHILRELLGFFPPSGWMFRVCRCFEAEQKASEAGNEANFPVFFVVCTKFKKLPNVKPVLELSLTGEQIQRVESPGDVAAAVRSLQHSALVLSRLGRGSLADHGEVCLDLCRPDEDSPRYTVHVLDQQFSRVGGRRYAAFIVPQGRETEWLFATPEGRDALLKSAGYDRLAVVALCRGHAFQGLDAVREELNESVLHLAPPGLARSTKIPFLSVGADVGHRDVCYRGHSAISGDFVVEEVEGDGGHLFRRLVFLSNQNVVQSEARLKLLKSRKGKPRKVVDVGHLACEHHTYMTVGVALAARDGSEVGAAVIGLGGGGLCTFLQHCFSRIRVTAVDIDGTMLEVATEYFDLVQDERLDVYIRDGIHFIQQAAEKGTNYHCVLFDVDSKTPGSPMSCPPQQFLEPAVLEDVKKCVGEKGIFVLNLVCRVPDLRRDVINNLKSVFASVISYKLEQEVNEIVFCSAQTGMEEYKWKNCVEEAANKVNALAKKKKLQSSDLVNVRNFVCALQFNL